MIGRVFESRGYLVMERGTFFIVRFILEFFFGRRCLKRRRKLNLFFFRGFFY